MPFPQPAPRDPLAPLPADRLLALTDALLGAHPKAKELLSHAQPTELYQVERFMERLGILPRPQATRLGGTQPRGRP